MTSALQKSQCCSATSAVQHSENCSTTSVFACGMLQGWGLEGWGFGLPDTSNNYPGVIFVSEGMCFRGRHGGVEKKRGVEASRMTPLAKRGFGPPPPSYDTFSTPFRCQCSVFPVPKTFTAQSRPEALWRGPKIFGRARSLVRFPPPIRFAPPYHGPSVYNGSEAPVWHALSLPHPKGPSVQMLEIQGLYSCPRSFTIGINALPISQRTKTQHLR